MKLGRQGYLITAILAPAAVALFFFFSIIEAKAGTETSGVTQSALAPAPVASQPATAGRIAPILDRNDVPFSPHSRGRAARPLAAPEAAGTANGPSLPQLAQSTAAAPPVINLWYGSTQSFGQLGTPQRWINILGNVSDPDGDLDSLQYALNGGPAVALGIGPSNRRLVNAGDFNIELDKDNLLNGANQLVITATDSLSNTAVATVTVNYDNTTSWPLPYTIDWSTVTNLLDVAQPVDGQWQLVTDGVRIQDIMYDRVLALGDLGWTDFEVTVPITIHAINAASYNDPYSVGPGIGLGVRWAGHTNKPSYAATGCKMNYCGWIPQGATPWYEFKQSSSDILRLDYGGGTAYDPANRQLAFGTLYYWKVRAQTMYNGTQYDFKLWAEGEAEPDWQMSGLNPSTNPDYLDKGSLILIAHHVDATFGDITVTPVNSGPYTLTVGATPNGSVTRNPNAASYLPGQPVTLTAVPNTGYIFTGWSGDLTGSANPAQLIMDSDKTVTPTFTASSTTYTLTVTADPNGSVTKTPDLPEYTAGQSVTLTAVANPGYLFTGWSGDLTGNDNPAVVVMDSNKTITPTFSVNTSGIEPDDFNSCTLSPFWTFTPGHTGDPVPALTGSAVSLIAPAGAEHSLWTDGNSTARLTQSVNDTDFGVEVKFNSTVTSQYQEQGILVEEADGDALRFEFYYDGSDVYFFAASLIGGGYTIQHNVPLGANTPAYMRVERTGDTWTHSYSYDGVNWTSRTFSQTFAPARLGPYGGNETPTSDPADTPLHTAVVDYFYNLAGSQPVPPDSSCQTYTLTVNTVGSGSVTVEPDQAEYLPGQVVTLTANPAPDNTFTGWSGDLIGSTNPVTLAMDSDKNITATFLANSTTYTLTIGSDPNGVVLKQPDQTQYLLNQTVTLTAVANPGYLFTGWSGDLTGNDNPAVVVMDSNKTITPTFSVNTSGIEPDDFNSCTLSPFWTFTPGHTGDPVPALTGSAVSLIAPAGAEHSLWTDGNSTARLTQSVNDTDFGVEVKFNSTVTSQYQEQGILVEEADGDALRFEFYYDGSDVYFFAASLIGGGYTIQHNVPLGANTPAYMRVERTGDTWTHSYSYDGVNWTSRTFSQTFAPARLGPYGGNETPTSDPADTPPHTAVIDYFYNLAGSQPVPPPADCTQYTVATNVAGQGSVTLDPAGGTYITGETVTVTAVPDPGWLFAGWSGDLTGTANPATILMDSDKTITATFTPVPTYTLSVTSSGSGSTVITPSQTVFTAGEIVTVTAVPDPGNVFTGWSGDLTGITATVTLTMDSDKTITATFVARRDVPDHLVMVNQSDSFTVTNPYGNDIIVEGKPAGAVFDSVTGQFTWIPTLADVGVYTLTFRDANSYIIIDTVTITVQSYTIFMPMIRR